MPIQGTASDIVRFAMTGTSKMPFANRAALDAQLLCRFMTSCWSSVR